MTRLVAGRLRGRTLVVPASGTRPTSDRVREALFSAIVARVDLDGARVLDLFAGSGALGLEAVSRGAAEAWFVDAGAPAAKALRTNLALAAPAATTLRRAPLPRAVEAPCPLAGGFDVVFADPPYALSAGVDRPVLEALARGGWVAEDGLVVWERSARDPAVRWPAGYDVVFDRSYGETAVEFARLGTVTA